MPSFSVLNDISAVLKQQVLTSLATAPDISFEVTNTNLLLSPPSGDLPSGALAVLYLFHVSVDPHLRNQPKLPNPDAEAEFIRPPLPLQLKYLFVPVDDEEENNQIMLGRVLQHFHDAPTFIPEPGTPLATHRGGVPPRIRVQPDLTSYEVLSNLWSAFAQPFRLSAAFQVDVIAIDSAVAPVVTPRTGSTFAAAGARALEDT